jgi:hypothetical protein
VLDERGVEEVLDRNWKVRVRSQVSPLLVDIDHCLGVRRERRKRGGYG